MRNRILKAIIGLAVLVIGCWYVSYLKSEKIKDEYFIFEIKYELMLLKALEDNKTDVVKSLYAGSINRVFVEVMKGDDIGKYSALCKDFTQDNVHLLKKYDLNISDESISSSMSKERLDREMEFIKSRDKLLKYCEEKMP